MMPAMTANKGIPFRSHLERVVADELDLHDVEWGYEVPVVLDDGREVRYLPDFTIFDAIEDLELPKWVEVKPQQMLYDLRDDLGFTRRHGERFGDDITWVANADTLNQYGFCELVKPRLLAEVTGEQVLVVGGVGGTSKLSVTMTADGLIFSRSQPFVNWRGVLQRREREERQAEYQRMHAEWEARRVRAEYERQRQAEESSRQAIGVLRLMLNSGTGREARYDGSCSWCRQARPSVDLMYFRREGRTVLACSSCREEARAT